MQSLWDTVFCDLWDCVLGSAGIQGFVKYTRDQMSSGIPVSTDRSRSDLSLRVNNKEVVYFEEDLGKATDTAHQARLKLEELDPLYYRNMKYMVCVSTKMTQFSVFAKSGSGEDYHTLIDEQAVDTPKGFSTAITTSINLLRYDLSWAPELAMTLRKRQFLNDFRKYGPSSNIWGTIKESACGSVEKTICLWSAHETLGYTHLDYVEKAMKVLDTYALAAPSVSDDLYTVKVKYAGLQEKPVDCLELKACLTDILRSLANLHEANLVHRDIRWANIVHDHITHTWWLIDYETVWESGYVPECDLVTFEHVLGEGEPYELKTDLKSVGRLIMKWRLSGRGCQDLRGFGDGRSCLECEDLRGFEGELLAGTFANARDALTVLQSWNQTNREKL